MILRAGSAVLAALVGAVSAHAALIASEDFEDENTGALNGQGAGADGGFDGTWSAIAEVAVVGSALNYANGVVASDGGSQALQVSFPNADIVDGLFSRTFTPAQSETVYLSFLFREIANPAFGTDFIQVGFENANPAQPLASVLRRNGTYQVRSGTSSTSGGTVGSTVADFETHLFVLKAEKDPAGGNYNKVSLFIDPDSLTEPGSPTEVSTANGGLAAAGLLTARSAFHAAGDTVQLDNIRIGTAWSDVVTPIPEPATTILAAIAGLGLLRRHRKRGQS
jgi:hypothetical protein